MFTDKLREGSTGPIAKFLFFIIMISFAIAGVGSYLMPKVDLTPVRVNGTPISNGDLEQQFRLEKNRLERQFGESFRAQANDPKFANQLKKQVLERMINDQAVSDHIFKTGIIVADALVNDRIRSMPEFQVNGKFSDSQFQKVLRYAGYISPTEFSEALKGDIAKEIYLKTAFDSGFALPSEVNALASMLSQERTFQKITIGIDSFKKGLTASQEEIKNYYDTHTNDYLLPEKVKVSYIYLTSEDLIKSVKYTDEDLKNFFNLHAELYTVPEKRTVSHILVTGDDAEKKIKEINEELKKGGDFAALAKKYSQDTTSKDKGGLLEPFSTGKMDSSFEKAAFALAKAGDVSEPVNSQFGWHLIRLEKIAPAHGQDFDKVKNDVIEKYTELQSHELFMDKKQIIADTGFENPDSLDPAMLAANKDNSQDINAPANKGLIKVETSDYIIAGYEKAPFPFSQPEVQKVLFSESFRQDNMNSDVIDLGDNAMVILHLEDYQAPKPKELKDITKEVSDAVITSKAVAASTETLNQVLKALESSTSLDNIISTGKIALSPATKLSRLNNEGVDAQVSEQVFSLPTPKAGNISYKDFTTGNGEHYVLVLTNVKNVELGEDENRDTFLNNQLYNFRYADENKMVVASSREEADIEYNTDREYQKYQEERD